MSGMVCMCMGVAKSANDRDFFLAKWVSNYQFEKKLKTSSLNFECENYV